MKPELTWAKSQIDRWASVLNDGALFYPGPDDGSAPPEVTCRVTLKDMAAFDLVDGEIRRIAKMGDTEGLKSLLVHVHWKGEELDTFRSLPWEGYPDTWKSMGMPRLRFLQHAYMDFVRAIARRGKRLREMGQKPLTGREIEK